MLKGIDPVLTPELLKLLMEMGHDDAIVLADANFTAVRYACGRPIIRLPGIGMARVCRPSPRCCRWWPTRCTR